MTMWNQGFFHKESILYLISFLCLFIYCYGDNCWITFDAKEHFHIMDKIDDRYEEGRENFQRLVAGNNFDTDMQLVMLKKRGIADRVLYKAKGDMNTIPAGFNLGGHCMMRVPKALLFFHRMKLRNDTKFQIVDLKNNLTTLELKAYILLNDLHLFGSYDISHTKEDNTLLLYYPSFGEVEFLLKNVSYKIEGRYRLLHNRLNLELVTSEIFMDDILMMQNSTNSLKLEAKNIESFTDRLKVDLDKWIKDYLNDYLTYFGFTKDSEFEKYNQEKTTALNNYGDKVIDIIKQRINKIKAHAVKLPKFTITTENGVDIRLRDGVLRDLDSIYRRSVTTGTKENNIRKVDTIVGFSNLKLSYRYDAIPHGGLPPVTGVLTLVADDLTAHLGLALIKDPESADLSIKFLEQTKPESLIVEGAANRMISNFKYVLERHVVGIMMNSLMHNINMLGTLDKCVPLLAAFTDPTDKEAKEDYSIEMNNTENSNKHEDFSEKKNNSHDIVETQEIEKNNENQQKSHETADNALNSDNEDNIINSQTSSTKLILRGYKNKTNIKNLKKLKYVKRNPKLKIKKQRKKTEKHHIK